MFFQKIYKGEGDIMFLVSIMVPVNISAIRKNGKF